MNTLQEIVKREETLDNRLRLLTQTIKFERQNRGWSVETLAEISALHPQTILHLENGTTTDPNLYTIYAIAKAFGTSVGWLTVGSVKYTTFTNAQYDYNRLGQQISFLRRSLGLSQRQFGEKIGKTKNQISNYEHGYTDIRYITALKMVDGTQYDIDLLLDFLYL